MAETRGLVGTVRGERLRIVAALSARFGDLELAEEAFAEACARGAALGDPPQDWAAWLYTVAARAAIDALRQRRTASGHAKLARTAEEDEMPQADAIPDRRLALLFACCHPAIDIVSRVALALTTICGFTAAQVASATLLSPVAVGQRLTRAKRKLAGGGIVFEIPDARFYEDRLEAVLTTVEIAYARAHASGEREGGHALLGRQSLELVELLADLLPDNREVRATAAALVYSEARRPARLDEKGAMVPLDQQNPQRWDRRLLDRAAAHSRAASLGENPSLRALRAQLQAAWCQREKAGDPAPWGEILALYDRLLTFRNDAFARLNRIVALTHVSGPEAAWEEFAALPADAFDTFPAYHAVEADLLARLNRPAAALAAYDRAIALQDTPAERAFLEARRAALRVGTSG